MQKKGTIQRLSDRVSFMIKELDLFDEKGNMKVYGDRAIEDLKKYAELMAEMESLHDVTDEIRESYLDMMDEAQEKFDEQLAYLWTNKCINWAWYEFNYFNIWWYCICGIKQRVL